ncbi:LapA family protein [bacterium]|nr:LapA family protein [bacterium]
MARFKSIAVALLAVLTLIFIIQNMEVVSIRFLFWGITLSHIVLLPLLIAVGFLAGYLSAKVTRPSKDQKQQNKDKK